MISNEELVAKVQEAKTRPNCFTLALIGAMSPTAQNPTPTAAANAAQQRGLSKEDVRRARWIAMYLKRGLGDGISLLAEFFESQRKIQKGKEAMTTSKVEEHKFVEEKEKEMVERELLDIALGLSGTQRDRDALAIAVLLESTLQELKSKVDAGQMFSESLPVFKMYFTVTDSECLLTWHSNFSSMGVRIALEIYDGGRVSIGHFTERGYWGTSFPVNAPFGFLQSRRYEISKYLKVSPEDYPRIVEFFRSAITMLPHLAFQKKVVS